MRLAELQRNFQSWLVSASDESASRFGAHAAAGLAVYQNNYRAQLVGSLEAAFPQVRAWMGEEAFLYAAVQHIDKHPPHAWTLDAYAENFGSTLATLFPYNPDIHELAWIELALSTAFVAADAQPLLAADLGAVNWDAATLCLTPSLQTTRLTTNAADIWLAMNNAAERPEGRMLDTPCGLMVWRRGFVSSLRTLEPLEHDALLALQAHGSFDALCNMLVERIGEIDGVTEAAAFLAKWIGSDLITGVEYGSASYYALDQEDSHRV
ncbi:DUF2063 domain-containing protein [Oxalobacteraceae bacterium OM1]|nr:DUF2063 domain-containing protein [Oxalobacteraceae bacterium OM1]